MLCKHITSSSQPTRSKIRMLQAGYVINGLAFIKNIEQQAGDILSRADGAVISGCMEPSRFETRLDWYPYPDTRTDR